jgi:TRAP-type mannitol/chloroaromatic compound transport system substrate-binding protein
MAIFSYLKLFLLDSVLQILALIYYYVPIGWSRKFIEKIYALKGIKLTLASFVGKKCAWEY